MAQGKVGAAVVVYVVCNMGEWVTYDDTTKQVGHTPNIEDAAMFSRLGALIVAREYVGQAYSYNLDTRKLRKVNK